MDIFFTHFGTQNLIIKTKTFFSHFQKKEAVGDDDSLPAEITSNLAGVAKEALEPLTVFQIKKFRSLVDEAMEKNKAELELHANERDNTLKEIANWVHDSVPVSNDEVSQPG